MGGGDQREHRDEEGGRDRRRRRHHHKRHHRSHRHEDGGNHPDSGDDEPSKRRRHTKHKHRHREGGPESAVPKAAEEARVDMASVAPIREDDYFLKNPEFCTWLVSSRSLYFSELSGNEARKHFADFVAVWNAGGLPARFYAGFDAGFAVPRTRPTKQAVSEHAIREERIKARKHELVAARESQAEAREALRRGQKADRRKAAQDQRARLEEMFPKATGRDALAEKRAASRAFHKEREQDQGGGFGDYTDAQLMGGSDSFAAAKAHQSRRQEHRKHNREMRRLEVSEKVARYQAAEDQKLDQFRALIQAGPIKIPKRT